MEQNYRTKVGRIRDLHTELLDRAMYPHRR